VNVYCVDFGDCCCGGGVVGGFEVDNDEVDFG